MRRGSWYVPGSSSMLQTQKTTGWAWGAVASSTQQSWSTNDRVLWAVHGGEWGYYTRKCYQLIRTPKWPVSMAVMARAMKNTWDLLPLSLKIPSPLLLLGSANLSPHFTMTYNLPVRNQSQSEQKWLSLWDNSNGRKPASGRLWVEGSTEEGQVWGWLGHEEGLLPGGPGGKTGEVPMWTPELLNQVQEWAAGTAPSVWIICGGGRGKVLKGNCPKETPA